MWSGVLSRSTMMFMPHVRVHVHAVHVSIVHALLFTETAVTNTREWSIGCICGCLFFD